MAFLRVEDDPSSGQGSGLTMATARYVQEVAEALKHCIGWSATNERLFVHRETWQLLPGMPALDTFRQDQLGNIVRGYIITEGLGKLTGTYYLFGRYQEADVLRRALLLLLDLKVTRRLALHRRSDALALMHANYSVGYWAHTYGPEWTLMYFLAEQLCDPAHAVRRDDTVSFGEGEA
jgi:hypothetical protein